MNFGGIVKSVDLTQSVTAAQKKAGLFGALPSKENRGTTSSLRGLVKSVSRTTVPYALRNEEIRKLT